MALKTDDRIRLVVILEATLGGTRKCAHDLLSHYDPEKYAVTYLFSRERADQRFHEDLLEFQRAGKIRLREIPLVREISPRQDFVCFWRLLWALREARPNLIHCHSSKAGFLGRIAARIAAPRAFTIYTPNSMALNIHPLYRHLESFAAFFTDCIIAAAETEKQEILDHGIIAEKKIRTISLGVSIPESGRSRLLREKLNIPNEHKIVMSIGRCTYQKDPLTFVQMAAKLIRKNSPLHFVWLGEGELSDELNREVNASALSHRFTYLPNQPNVQELLSGADIFCLCSRYESFGYVTAEAMAWGLPVVATDVVGTRTLVLPGITGELVPKEDPMAMATAVDALASDDKKCKDYGQAGRDRAIEYFSVNRMVQETEALYRELLASRNNKHRYRDTCQAYE